MTIDRVWSGSFWVERKILIKGSLDQPVYETSLKIINHKSDPFINVLTDLQHV